jgi:asparagine synthase (glutamine-hydrolysing)
LYFACNDRCLAFASEIKALKVWPFISWDVSVEDMAIFLRHSYLPSPRTGWTQVHKLKPGSLLKWRAGQWSQQRYFNLPTPGTQDHKPQQLFTLLDQSVKNCLVADKPVGAFLSGGIDSTTVVTLMRRHQQNFPVFSIDWREASHSEGTYIQQVVHALRLNHFKILCDAQFLKDHFEHVVKMFDEPFGDESMIPTFCLAQAARGQVSVVLTGDGSDEFFHGYERYFYKGTFHSYIDVFSPLPQKTKEKIFSKEFLEFPSDEDGDLLARYLQSKKQVCEQRRRSWVDIQTYLPDDILTKVDRMTMSVGLEARAPFLTPAVTDFALRCCMQELVGKQGRGKEILRAAMKDYLPPTILERKKMGFGVPLKEWFCFSLKTWMQERLLNGWLFSTGWFSREGIEELIAEHVAQGSNHSRAIFNLLVLETWLRSNRS